MTDDPPSSSLRSALAYLTGLRLLVEAERRGELADSSAIEREIDRAEACVQAVLSMLTEVVTDDYRPKPQRQID